MIGTLLAATKSLLAVMAYKSNEHSSPKGLESPLSNKKPRLDIRDSAIILDSENDASASIVVSVRLLVNMSTSLIGRVATIFAVITSTYIAQIDENDASDRANACRALHCKNVSALSTPDSTKALARLSAEPKEHQDEVGMFSSGGFACKNEATLQFD
jgi:hypothetical protein